GEPDDDRRPQVPGAGDQLLRRLEPSADPIALHLEHLEPDHRREPPPRCVLVEPPNRLGSRRAPVLLHRAQSRWRSSRPRAITTRWISFVPSPMIINVASR